MLNDCPASENNPVSMNKNAFKVVSKGVYFSKSINKRLREDFGCFWSATHKAYVGPRENEIALTGYLKELGMEIRTEGIVDLDVSKSHQVRGMESTLWALRRKARTEYESLIVDMAVYDKTLLPKSFEQAPIPEHFESDIRYRMALDFHRRYKELSVLEEDINNRTISLKLHEDSIDGETSIPDAVVAELNQRHAIVHTSQTYVLTEKPRHDGKGICFTLETRQSLINLYENQLVDLGDGKRKNKAKIWLEHEHRRQYNGITFDPTRNGHNGDQYNIWQGFAVEAKEGSCDLFKAHMRDVICQGNEERYKYLWRWCAHLFQNPDKPLPALLLMSNQGTGKNTFVDALGLLLGPHYLPLDSMHQLLGTFNFHQKDAVLIHGNEALWGGQKKDIGKLKTMITEEYCCIEGKGKDAIITRNFRHLILSSNEDWPVHLSPDERRILVLQVSEARKEDTKYFRAIKDELRSGGYAALLYELLHQCLQDFDPNKLPKNSEAFDVKIKSAASTDQYIYEVLLEGCFNIGNATSHTESWKTFLTKDAVYTDYRCWCDRQSIKPEAKAMLGKTLFKLIPSTAEARPLQQEGRPRCYELPLLEKAREEFQKAYKSGAEIWSGG